MRRDELVKLAQDVATVHVRASALGETGVASTLEMALDELLEVLADELEKQVGVAAEPDEFVEP